MDAAKMPLLSVIVPVYKVESTLDRCVESIIRQDYPRMEIILIDDGSPDRCPQMCDEWAARDGRIRTVHQQNKGLSGARNAGLDIAQGDFITFVDSDDQLAANTYGGLMATMLQDNAPDILEYEARLDAGTDKAQPLSLPDDNTYETWEDYWFATRAYLHCYAWNKIYRRHLFKTIRYPEGKVFEDVFTTPQLLRKARQIATTNKGTYLYYSNADGISRQLKEPHLRNFLEAHTQLLPHFLEKYKQGEVSRRDMSEYYIHVFNIQVTLRSVAKSTCTLPHFRPCIIRNRGKNTLIKTVLLQILPVGWASKITTFATHL